MNTMTYKGYEAIVEYDEDAELLHGEVMNLRDVITFQGQSVSELKQAFADSVDDYLAFCKERGEEPEKPYSGQFVVRVEPPLHRAVVTAARKAGQIPQTEAGDIFGHEFMGIVEETGSAVTDLQVGDRVVIPFVIACGSCFFCQHALFAACETTNTGRGSIIVRSRSHVEELRKELVAWVRREIGPNATPDFLQWAPGLPKTRSGKIMRRILRKVAENAPDQLGDTSTLADPSVVDSLVKNRRDA